MNPNGITYSGFTFYDALNWLEYSILTSDNEKAVMLAVELYYMGKLDNTSFYEDFIDKLIIIASTDIADYSLALSIIDYLNRYAYKMSYVEVISLVITMCDETKSMLNYSYYKLAVHISEGRCDNQCEKNIQNIKQTLRYNVLSSLHKESDTEYYSFIELLDQTQVPEKLTKDDIFKLYLLDISLKRYREGNVGIGQPITALVACIEALSKHIYNIDMLAYINEYGGNEYTRDPMILLWDIINYNISDEVNDSFWIANNILKYAYFNGAKRQYHLLVLAISYAKLDRAYEERSLRFEEADPMENYFVSKHKMVEEFKKIRLNMSKVKLADKKNLGNIEAINSVV